MKQLKHIISLGLFTILCYPYILFAQGNIVRYQYWFDNNFDKQITMQVTPSHYYHISDAVSTEGLSAGLHILNVRAQSNQGDTLLLWGSTVSHYFFKNSSLNGLSNPVAAYQYWYDNDIEKAVTQSVKQPLQELVISDKINTAGISSGLHTFNVRVMDNSGLWSSPMCLYFFKNNSAGDQANPITSYQYWFDNDISNAVTQILEYPSQQLVIDDKINATEVSTGLHTFNVRVMDNSGVWSSPISHYFFKSALSGEDKTNKIASYQYWFDNEFRNAQEIELEESTVAQINQQISVSSLTNGLHYLNIRSRDNSGLWSSTICHLFFKQTTVSDTLEDNFIVAYQYWFTGDDDNVISSDLSDPAKSVVIDDLVDFTRIPKGIYEVNFRFKDSKGLWSSTITDTVEKVSFPIADFDYKIVAKNCDSTVVSFTDNSIDGDIFTWSFDDGLNDTTQNPVHTFYETGVYYVSLNVTDTILHKDSMLLVPVNISMETYQEIDEIACDFYSSPDGNTYTESGTYKAIIPNVSGCDSIITINLTVNKTTEEDTFAVACEFFEWYGVNYTETPKNNPKHFIKNVSGCDSVITLHLTINPSYNMPDQLDSVAQGMSYINNGWDIDTKDSIGGIYRYSRTETSSLGCDSIVNLQLYVKSETSEIQNILSYGMTLNPNPATSYVDLLFNEYLNGCLLKLYSSDGQLLYLETVYGNAVRLNLTKYQNGLYVIRCGHYWGKLIVYQ